MFSSLSSRLNGIFSRLTSRGALTAAEVSAALREVRIALLEADVALPVVKTFLEQAEAAAIGQQIIKSVNPGQQVIKIVHDVLVDVLGNTAVPLQHPTNPPTRILMLGLQGSGKTTTSGKLAKWLMAQGKKVLLVSLDTYRPAAQEQLAILAQQVGADALPIVAGEAPLAIARRALQQARISAPDVVIFDTAGRLTIDNSMMDELAALHALIEPTEQLLVLDAMTGQDALTTAQNFQAQLPLTGLVLTRLDGDARGGAALSLRHATGQPIKFFGVGEKLDALEVFHPQRLASRILGMGDVVSLVERAAANIDQEAAAATAEKIQRGQFDLSDMLSQLRQMKKMGSLTDLLGLIPGMSQLKDKIPAGSLDDKMLKRQEAIILSMTPAERQDVGVLNGSRRRRIANGAGVQVAEVNRLIKQYLMMRDTMKQMKKMGKGGKLPLNPAMFGMAGKSLPTQLGNFPQLPFQSRNQ